MSRSSAPPKQLPRFNIEMPSASKHVKPGDDFYMYVNAKWQRGVHVPRFVSSYGISEEIKGQIDKQTESIVQQCIDYSKTAAAGKEDYFERLQRTIGTVALSGLKPSYQMNSVRSLQSIINKLDCMRDLNDVGHTLGEMCKYKVPSLFWFYGQYENKKKSQYCLSIGMGKLGLPDVSYYHKQAPGKSRTLLLYANLLQDVGRYFGIANLSSIVPIETYLSEAIEKGVYEDEVERSGADLEHQYPDIPWESFFQSYDLPEWKTRHFFVDSCSWIKRVQKLFRSLSLENWKLLMSAELLLFFLPYLPPPFDDIHYRFFHHRLRGQTQKTPQTQMILYLMEDYMAPMISRLYVKHFVPASIKTEVNQFVDKLRAAAEDRLGQTDWLQPHTRKAAQEKLRRMNQAVAYPDEFGVLDLPVVKPENLIENILLLGLWRSRYELSRVGERRKQQKDWDDPVFAVNAYYYEQANEIVIPAGSLYWPFYATEAKPGWNFGGLGAVLGHEMTHAFDEDGKDFDPDGYEKRWWTAADNRAYNKRTRSLVALFSKQRILGHPVNGNLTLNENISDLGGLAIALQALEKELGQATAAEKKEAYRSFFTSYALSWRTKDKPAKMLQALFLDRHAPPKFRVNLIVSQFQQWYDAFDVEPSDKMYIPPEERIRIF